MTAQLKKILAYTLSILLGVFLLYLALQDVELEQLKDALARASYIWVAPIVLFILISHLLRAWRWQMLLEALPDRQRKGELGSISFKTTFYSLIIGYFVNLLVPRLGEVARAGNLSRHERIRFSGVFGTVVAERVFDMIILGFGIASLSFLYYDQFLFLQNKMLTPLASLKGKIPFGWSALGLTGIGAICYLAIKSIKSSQSTKLMNLRRRAMSIANSFKDGVMTLLLAPRRIAILFSTAAMWLCYAIMALFTFYMLDMQDTYHLGFGAAWSIMIFGAIGFAVPAPGGTGSFHYITKLVLVNLFFVDEATAFAYPLISHGLQVVIYVIAGVFALFVQGTNLKTLRNAPLETD